MFDAGTSGHFDCFSGFAKFQGAELQRLSFQAVRRIDHSHGILRAHGVFNFADRLRAIFTEISEYPDEIRPKRRPGLGGNSPVNQFVFQWWHPMLPAI